MNANPKSTDSRMKVARWTLVALGVLVGGVLLSDYFTPAELQVDLNAPRFRLVRHRVILPDKEFEMEWKHINKWSESASDCPPAFGQRTVGGVYAWEINGIMTRFENIYEEVGGGTKDEWIRTNYGSYQMNARDLAGQPMGRLRSASEWVQGYRHQKKLSVSQEEIDAAEAAQAPTLLAIKRAEAAMKRGSTNQALRRR